MKKLLRIILWIVFFALLISGGTWIYLASITPNYSGNVELEGLGNDSKVTFDEWGIPHIEAQSEEDLYRTFGYVHAQERLFQMELMRRVGSGTLSEVLGKDLIDADVLFRTMGVPRKARESADRANAEQTDERSYKMLQAYLDGINQFIDQGPKPIEFSLMGIPKKKFTTYDIYCIAGYMAFSFNLGTRTDPLVNGIYEKYGEQYLTDLNWYTVDSAFVDTTYRERLANLSSISSDVQSVMDRLPVVPFMGSNGWAVSGDKTASGKVMLSNDTHIGYSQPAVWYEAHLKCPGFDFYGNFLGGIPFALVGHNRDIAWGLTILEEDDCDFYRETFKSDDTTLYKSGNDWLKVEYYTDTISIKGENDTIIKTPVTHHGPVVNGAFEQISGDQRVSIWWNYHKFENDLLSVFYEINHSSSLTETKEQVSRIHGPGLNIIYGDEEGNIAWWGASRLLDRPDHVKGKLFLDGASGKDEPLGYLPFSQNPQQVNPPNGFVYSANDQPQLPDSSFYPGYYKPKHRAMRIKQMLDPVNDWDLEKMKSVITDVTSPVDSEVSKYLYEELRGTEGFSPAEARSLSLLIWDGSHGVEDTSPSLYYRLLERIIYKAMSDELSKSEYDLMLKTHLIKKAYPELIKSSSSIWWDDIRTDVIETREDILRAAYSEAVSSLVNQFGEAPADWKWGKLHTLELAHPIGKVDALRPFFNIGPEPTQGGYETVNQADFLLDNDGTFQVKAGPQMRIILDFEDITNSISISPSGQSGHFFSDHYSDQAEMYRMGVFRNQSMSTPEDGRRQLIFLAR
jgi:penicillin amidase